MKPSQLDILLHTISLQISLAYKMAFEDGKMEGDIEQEIKKDLIEAYTDIRRHISKDENGKRFGASYSNQLLQLGEI